MQNFWEHLFWRTSAIGCFCFSDQWSCHYSEMLGQFRDFCNYYPVNYYYFNNNNYYYYYSLSFSLSLSLSLSLQVLVFSNYENDKLLSSDLSSLVFFDKFLLKWEFIICLCFTFKFSLWMIRQWQIQGRGCQGWLISPPPKMMIRNLCPF